MKALNLILHKSFAKQFKDSAYTIMEIAVLSESIRKVNGGSHDLYRTELRMVITESF